MEYITLAILIIILILLIIILFKSKNESNIIDKISKLELSTIKELGEFKSGLERNINNDFNTLNERIDIRLRLINDKVNERLNENLEKTNQTFNRVLERLAKIDEAQKKIDNLSTDIVSLQNVLTDKKARGTFGEINLKHIMSSVFGNNNKIYQMQYKFATGDIADCVLFAPEPLGVIAIDSKFPLENYQRMVDKTIQNKEIYEKQFIIDMKKHIDAISSKYIIPNVTTDQAILFLPAEAIFAELNAYHQELIEYAYKKRVWITSPTTLISTLTTIEIVIKNIERDKYASLIHEQLKYLNQEFIRYKERWDKLSTHIETVSRDVHDIHATTEKITKRFDSINKVESKELE